MFSLFSCCKKNTALEEPLLDHAIAYLPKDEALPEPKLPMAPPSSPKTVVYSQAEQLRALHDYLLYRIRPLNSITYLQVCNHILQPLKQGKYHVASSNFCKLLHQKPTEFKRICHKFDIICANIYKDDMPSLRQKF